MLAGFLSLLPIPVDYHGKIINVHPSLLPAFGGRGFHGEAVHRAAIELGVKVSGCTVHFVDEVYDNGPIILQRTVPVLDDDTPSTLAARVQAAERVAPDLRTRIDEARSRLTAAMNGHDVTALQQALDAFGHATQPLAEMLMNAVLTATLAGRDPTEL